MAYKGSQAVVDVPQAGLYGVKRGEPVEVASEHVRARLHRQGWEYVHAPEGDKPHATAKAVRAWAKENGIDVPNRGAIPHDVREKFDAAHAEDNEKDGDE